MTHGVVRLDEGERGNLTTLLHSRAVGEGETSSGSAWGTDQSE